jgi:hypothetical protein
MYHAEICSPSLSVNINAVKTLSQSFSVSWIDSKLPLGPSLHVDAPFRDNQDKEPTNYGEEDAWEEY